MCVCVCTCMCLCPRKTQYDEWRKRSKYILKLLIIYYQLSHFIQFYLQRFCQPCKRVSVSQKHLCIIYLFNKYKCYNFHSENNILLGNLHLITKMNNVSFIYCLFSWSISWYPLNISLLTRISNSKVWVYLL